MKTNKKEEDTRMDKSKRLAGGFGAPIARQGAEDLLRRAVMTCLLWEDLAYDTGVNSAINIAELVPQVAPEKVAQIAWEARNLQKLRHVPLFIAREMARHTSHRKFLGALLPEIIQRADEVTEFMSMYWKDGKQPIAKQVKIGLAEAIRKFDSYQLSKYKGEKDTVSLRDVVFMTHPIPSDEGVFFQLSEGTLTPPETWEVRLSAGENKAEVFSDLISRGKLGALAFLRNLRNMEESGVPSQLIKKGLSELNSKWLLPVNYISAVKVAPRYEKEIEDLMLRGYSQLPKLSGHTVFVVDVSGSMQSAISSKSELQRTDVAYAMAVMAREVCESVSIYATAGSDPNQVHRTELVPSRRGFALASVLQEKESHLGGGGIFTRQCLEYIKKHESEKVDRIIVFSDSQDCDRLNKIPSPFGLKNYIVDVSSQAHGINYAGIWTAEVSGWSEHFLTFIASVEGLNWNQE